MLGYQVSCLLTRAVFLQPFFLLWSMFLLTHFLEKKNMIIRAIDLMALVRNNHGISLKRKIFVSIGRVEKPTHKTASKWQTKLPHQIKGKTFIFSVAVKDKMAVNTLFEGRVGGFFRLDF